MGAINRDCRKKLILGALELGRAIYEINFRESSPVGEKRVSLLVPGGIPF